MLKDKNFLRFLEFVEDNKSYSKWLRDASIYDLLQEMPTEYNELLEALNKNTNISEEMGDIIYDAFLLLMKLEMEGITSRRDVFKTIVEKLKRRKPFVFNKIKVSKEKEISAWMDAKYKEKDYTEYGAGYVLFFDSMFLLLKNVKGYWEFPKGHKEQGESFLSCAQRETEEETHLCFTRVNGFSSTIKYSYFKNNVKPIRKVVKYYLGKAHSKNVILSSEHEGYLWTTYEEALNLLTYDAHKYVLKKANDFLRETYGN